MDIQSQFEVKKLRNELMDRIAELEAQVAMLRARLDEDDKPRRGRPRKELAA